MRHVARRGPQGGEGGLNSCVAKPRNRGAATRTQNRNGGLGFARVGLQVVTTVAGLVAPVGGARAQGPRRSHRGA